MPADLWSVEEEGRGLDPLDALVYRSHLLGSDRAIVNYGGGNTSIKSTGTDHLGHATDILWIKGSGSDLGTMGRSGFAPLKLREILGAQSRLEMTDEEMVGYLARCSLDPDAPRPSIETMLHAFLPFEHVDHTHPEAAIAFCCSAHGEDLARDCFGDEMVWVPYVRPGFALAKLAIQALDGNPRATGMLLAKHGLVTWGSSGRESYQRTIDFLSRAERFLEDRINAAAPFGSRTISETASETRRKVMIDVLPVLRGELSKLIGGGRREILSWDDSQAVLDFVSSSEMPGLAGTGSPCPDHVLYTKFLPLVIEAEDCREACESRGTERLVEALQSGICRYVEEYRRFFDAHRDPGTDMLNPGPRVILIPGFGCVSVGRDAWSSRNTSSLYRTAINVMRWSAPAGYSSLTAEEAYNVEYWPLELYKLTKRPPPRQLDGHVAIVTGGAGAIGRATTARFLSEDAHVVIQDIDGDRAQVTADEVGKGRSERVVAVAGDAGNDHDVRAAFEEAVLAFGGVDIVVPNAGVASAAPIDEISLEEWDSIQQLLLRGCFLACRTAFKFLKRQGIGGAIVINSSKNGLAAGKNAIAYASAKAAQVHMGRCLAEEGGPFQIRVNVVAPDAVIRGSGLWSQEWREARARAYGFDVEDLEEYYRRRNALQVEVTAEDVAEAILFLASGRSAKTTGCVITVDGGLKEAYPR